jgi:hypothetical protein
VVKFVSETLKRLLIMEAKAKPVFVTEKVIKLDDGTTATYTG